MKKYAYFIALLSLAIACGKTENKNQSTDTLAVQSDTTVTDETPTLDDYLVDSINDTAIQKISGRLVLLVLLGEQQVDFTLKEYGEEAASTILDDASFYQSSAANLVDSLGIKTVNSEKRFIHYQNVIREWNLDLYKSNSPWVVIFFDLDQRPEVVPTSEVTKEKIKEYFDL